MIRLSCRSSIASNAGRANHDVVVPESIDISAVRLPPEVDPGDIGFYGALLPLGGIAVCNTCLDSKTSNSDSIQPSLNGADKTQVVFEAFPGAGGKGGGGGNTLRREIGKGGIVGLAVVHQDFALATNAEVLVGPLGRVRHGDEGDVGVGEGLRGFARRGWMLALPSNTKLLPLSRVLFPPPKVLQPCPDVNITARYLRRAKENMSTEATRTINPYRVFAAVGGSVVKGDFATLVTAGRIDGPCSLVPPAFEVLGDLGKGEREESKGEKSSLEEHFLGMEITS